MRTLYCGPGGIVQPGGEANLPTDEAKNLIEQGYADPVERAERVETAEASQPEQAAVRTGKRGRK
ncbi:MAG: hypothetical protein KDK05_08225 [Candidatus Competibacteraceae bacterium]|nr:hypothetical protein [Candidatus Competibacteraceae bacterium]